MNWLDISTPLTHGMPRWPEDPEVRLERRRSIAAGDAYNLTVISMSAHTGTHVDAPLHYLEDGLPVDRIPVEDLMGPAVVLAGADLAPAARAGRLLFKLPELSVELAARVVERKPRMVGIASMSIGSDEVHRLLLASGIWIVEGLDLSSIEPGIYEFLCLPLRLSGAEGAPARALLRPLVAG